MPGLDSGSRVERGLDRLGYTYYNPKTFERWVSKGREITRSVQLFPGYMFVNIVAQWRVLCGTRGVTGLIRNSDGPVFVPQTMIDQLKEDERVDGHIYLPQEFTPRFELGQGVHLTDGAGAYANRFAIYDGMSGLDRAAVLLQMLGKQVRIVVPESALAEVA